MSGDVRELDWRTNDGISVTLLWDAQTDRVFVSVLEERDGASFEFEVAAADAADAFHHPYAYRWHASDTQSAAVLRRSD